MDTFTIILLVLGGIAVVWGAWTFVRPSSKGPRTLHKALGGQEASYYHLDAGDVKHEGKRAK